MQKEADKEKKINRFVNTANTRMQTFVFAVIFISLVFAMSIVRSQCIGAGYELSQLSSEVEKRRIVIESIEARQAKVLNKEALFNTAMERGFILMSEGRTFNVQ